MKSRPVFLLTAAFVLVFFAMGIPYWQIPYAKASLPDSLYGPLMATVVVAALVVRLLSNATFLKTWLVVGLAVPAMVMARVIVEVVKDSTSHNLWPFEIVIAAAVGLMLSMVGALCGGVVRRVLAGRKEQPAS